MSQRTIWLDGRLVPWDEATVHVLSQSIQRGSLVFDVLPCYSTSRGSAILGFREHSERFCRSAEQIGMDLGLDLEAVQGAIAETLRANPGSDIVKISAMHPGISLDVLPRDRRPSVSIAAFALAELLPAGFELPLEPARLQLAAGVKTSPRTLSPQIKVAAGYTAAALAKGRATGEGFDDILFLDELGNVAESSTQSFLLVQGGEVWAPPLDYVLSGITRRVVLELARDEKIPVRVAPVPRSALAEADEAFLAGTTTNVRAVQCVDTRDFPVPLPGPVTGRLRERFERLIKGEDPVFSPRWLQPV